MKLWADFHPLVLPSAPECPIPVADNALRLAARDFCVRTRAWRETEDLEAQGDTNLFDIDIPTGTELVRFTSADVGGKDFSVFGLGLLPKDWAERDPRPGLYHVADAAYRVFPMPIAGAAMVIEAAVMPGMTGTGVSDEVFRLYAENIASGALCRLMKLPRQPWTDLAMASYHEAAYERAIHSAANRGFMQTSPGQHRVQKWG